MRIQLFYLESALFLAFACLLGCGDEAPVNPEFSDLQLVCESGGAETPSVVDELRVKVTDPDRDLVSVEGTLNGIQVILSDPDADLYFTWSPPEGADPMACDGDFVVSLEAADAKGNTAQMYEIVAK